MYRPASYGHVAVAMCRYARRGVHQYRTHYTCLPCRHTAKFEPAYEGAPVCPFCRNPMVNMGRDFKPPRKGNASQWEKIRRLAATGIFFDSCGCTGPGPRPHTLSDAKTQLRQRRTDRKRWRS